MVNSWYNNDGLYIKYGTDEVASGTQYGVAGELMIETGYHEVQVILNPLTALGATAAIIDDNVAIPVGARILSVDVITEVAATSGGLATLNVGLMRTDRSTSISDTAILNAVALSAINTAGTLSTITVGSTGAGANIGVTITGTTPAYITAKYGTAAFTAGVIRLRIRYEMTGATPAYV